MPDDQHGRSPPGGRRARRGFVARSRDRRSRHARRFTAGRRRPGSCCRVGTAPDAGPGRRSVGQHGTDDNAAEPEPEPDAATAAERAGGAAAHGLRSGISRRRAGRPRDDRLCVLLIRRPAERRARPGSPDGDRWYVVALTGPGAAIRRAVPRLVDPPTGGHAALVGDRWAVSVVTLLAVSTGNNGAILAAAVDRATRAELARIQHRIGTGRIVTAAH